jgi:Mrp family chromosome partitioning ATPase
MRMQELLWACRRWWRVILLTTAVCLTLAWATAPSHASEVKAAKKDVTYKATATVLPVADHRVSLDQLALLTTTGPVPAQARTALGLKGGGSGSTITSDTSSGNGKTTKRSVTLGTTQVVVQPDNSGGALLITANDHLQAKPPKVAKTLADTLVNALSQQTKLQYFLAHDKLDKQRVQLQDQVNTLQGQWLAAVSAKAPNADAIKSDYDAAVRQLGDTQQQILALEAQGPTGVHATVLEVSGTKRVVSSSKLGAPKSRTGRLGLGVLLGLAIGGGIAILLERKSETVLGLHSVEGTTSLPVITEVPFVRLPPRRRRDVLSFVMPESRVAEAYRGLRTSISLMWMANSSPANDVTTSSPDVPSVLMIASPGPSEGKSTTVANLAACYAEIGKNVIAIDLDTRRQKLHKLLGAEPEPHLENIGTPTNPQVDLDTVTQDTMIPRVKLISSSSRDTSPGDMLIAARAAVTEARERADVVILDTPPLLYTNAAYELIGLTDAFVLLVRDAKTKRTAAERASQMLRRLDAPVLGVAMIAAMSGRRGYPYNYGYGYGYGYGGYFGDTSWRSIFRRKPSAPREKIGTQEQQ